MSEAVPESVKVLTERERLRAEVEALRDEKDRLAFLDDAAQPVMMSWEQAHKHHADEPYIGCVFCRDKFVPQAELDRLRAVGEELYEAVWALDLSDDYTLQEADPGELVRCSRPVNDWIDLVEALKSYREAVSE